MVRVTNLAFPDNEMSLPNFDSILLLATIGFYALHRSFRPSNFTPANSGKARFGFIQKYRKALLYSGVFVLFSSFFLAANFIPRKYIYLLVPATIVTIFYVLPLFPGKKRLRDFPFIKILLIAVIWTYVTALLPLFEEATMWTYKALYSIDRFLFIFAITLPFDIRDLELDRTHGTRTIPLAIGTFRSKLLAILMLIIGVMIIYVLRAEEIVSEAYHFITMIVYSVAALLIWNSNINRKDYYFTGFIDGLMILFFVLLWFVS
jgi:4-hydroxybenzoate polyprenyltransferase